MNKRKRKKAKNRKKKETGKTGVKLTDLRVILDHCFINRLLIALPFILFITCRFIEDAEPRPRNPRVLHQLNERYYDSILDHEITVISEGNTFSHQICKDQNGEKIHTKTIAGVKISIINHQVYINDLHYGEIRDKERILIDRNVVKIQGKTRAPVGN